MRHTSGWLQWNTKLNSHLIMIISRGPFPAFFIFGNKISTMKKHILSVCYLLFLIVFLQACQQTNERQAAASVNDRLLMAALYQQSAAEKSALYHQAFNIADIMIRDEMSKNISGAKRAIITDIDETVLDNTPYQAKCILENISYPEKWDEWCKLAIAEAYPGSQRFFNMVADQGIEIFYITNRKSHLLEATIQNLKIKGFPFADEQHLLMRDEGISKEKRRRLISDKYRVVMLLGDNLEDFNNVFEGKSPGQRNELVERMRTNFGRHLIVFPNPMYGSWETAVYQANPDSTIRMKDTILKNALIGF